jgi:PKD repeat protein
VVNLSPVASTAGSTPLAGVAPLLVKLVGTASTDPDGVITSYRWEFGDGSPVATTPTADHTYAAGTYTARLVVTDDRGASSSKTLQIVVSPPAPSPPPPTGAGYCRVSSIDMTWVKLSRTAGLAQGVVTIVDQAGKPVAGALVNVKATGLVVGSGQGRTDFRGRITLVTNRLSSALKGDLTFSVTGVAHPKYAYDAARNAVSDATLTLAGTTVVVQPPSYRPQVAGDADACR